MWARFENTPFERMIKIISWEFSPRP